MQQYGQAICPERFCRTTKSSGRNNLQDGCAGIQIDSKHCEIALRPNLGGGDVWDRLFLDSKPASVIQQ